jgi:hypothetical protein
MAAHIMAACKLTALLMGAFTTAAFRNSKTRSEAVLVSHAPVRGKTSTNPGASAAAITATEFPITASGNTSAKITISASLVSLWFSLVECRASSTTDTGLRSWIRGRNRGGPIGTKPTMCILTTTAMGTTSMTAHTLVYRFQS